MTCPQNSRDGHLASKTVRHEKNCSIDLSKQMYFTSSQSQLAKSAQLPSHLHKSSAGPSRATEMAVESCLLKHFRCIENDAFCIDKLVPEHFAGLFLVVDVGWVILCQENITWL